MVTCKRSAAVVKKLRAPCSQ